MIEIYMVWVSYLNICVNKLMHSMLVLNVMSYHRPGTQRWCF